MVIKIVARAVGVIIEGSICPSCRAGSLRRFEGELSGGEVIYFFRCTECKEAWYPSEALKLISAAEGKSAETKEKKYEWNPTI